MRPTQANSQEAIMNEIQAIELNDSKKYTPLDIFSSGEIIPLKITEK